MPRQLRVEYPVAISHVMSRGVRKTDICVDDVERQDFLKSLVENLPQDRFPAMRIASCATMETALTACQMAQRPLGSWKSLDNKLLFLAGPGAWLQTVCPAY